MPKDKSETRPVGRPPRIQRETIDGFEHIEIAPGEPLVLQGLNVEKKKWEDVVVVSSHGGRCKVPEGRYAEYRFDDDTNKRMTFEAPVVSASPGAKRKPRIIKKKKE